MNAGAADAEQSGLLTRAQDGDRDAVEELLRRHYDAVHAVCHRMISSRDGADDAVQNALLGIVRGLPRFDRRSQFSTWVYRIATNAALDEIRRAQRAPQVADPSVIADTESADSRSDVTAEVADRLTHVQQIGEALADVAHEYRVVLVLRYVAELDYAEIAEVLDVPVGTVRSRLARGKSAFAERLAGSPGGNGMTGQTSASGPNLHGNIPRGQP